MKDAHGTQLMIMIERDVIPQSYGVSPSMGDSACRYTMPKRTVQEG